MKAFFKNNKVEALLLLSVLVLALFLRLYRIDGFMTFLGDEGRDVRIVRDLITQGNLVFIGPQTSVGNMYLGPLYYYMMAPALFLSGLNPVGPAVMVALLGVLTIWLTWYVARRWFGKEAAFFAALIYAVSPVAIIYSRTSWNPNPMPFFALLCVLGIYQVWQNKKYLWLPFIGISFAFALQMHYLGLLLAPTIGLFWLLSLLQIKKDKALKGKFVKYSLIAIFVFFVLMSPLLLFDLKHQGMNYHALQTLLSAKSGVFNLGSLLTKPFTLLSFVTSALLSGTEKPALLVAAILCLISLSFLFIKRSHASVKIIASWIGFAILGLSLYTQPIYIHYLGVIYPAVILLFASIFATLYRKSFYFKWLAILSLASLFVYDLYNSPAFGSPNYQLRRTQEAVDLVIKESGGEPFNFGLIAENNYDESYRYFFENKKANMVRGEDKVTDQLFVICEDGDTCRPEGHPQYQIAIFGPSHVVYQWNIDYLKIYKLEHTR